MIWSCSFDDEKTALIALGQAFNQHYREYKWENETKEQYHE